jgi:holo-[acyl-carrier protein] synthase
MTIVSVGSDIIECVRIGQMIEQHGESFLRKVFTTSEIEYCSARALATQHYAARWVGKNAVRKALGLRFRSGLSWRDFEVQTTGTGPATVRLGGQAREASVAQRIHTIHISLSTSRTMAVAFAVAERP